MDNNSNSHASCVSFVGLLTVAFIVLKLLNIITWSWLWVLSPIWISTGLVILVLLGVILSAAIVIIIENRRAKNDD